MASTDAKQRVLWGVAHRIVFPILDADGDLVTGATGLDSEVSKDQGTFADCTNEATEIATSSGIYYLDLSATEMEADCITVIVKTSSSGAKTTTIVLYTDRGIRSRKAQAGAAGTITLDASASATDDFYNGSLIEIVGGTGAGQSGRIITDYVGSTKVASVGTNWVTNPDSTSVFRIDALPGVLAASTPTNFSVLAIDTNGRIQVQPGTSTGQLDITSGVVKSNLAQILGTALTETAGQIAAAFKQFFDVASPTGTMKAITNVVTATNLTNAPTAAVATTSNIKKNQALSSFMFVMRDSTNHAPATGKTVSVFISKDGAAFAAAATATATEVSNGWYKISFTQTEMNANVIALRATATACDDFTATILTQP